jgi:transposase
VGGDQIRRAKIGCTRQTLLGWVKQDEVDSGKREGGTTSERERLKTLEREVKELRRTNEILKLASVFFARAMSFCGTRCNTAAVPVPT